MVTTTYTDATFGVRELQARTDSAGSAVTDLPLDEDRIVNALVGEGALTVGAFGVSAQSPAAMAVDVGSGAAKADIYVVGGDSDGQHPYLVRLDDTDIAVTVPAADGSLPRIDEVWLVVLDDEWDSTGLALARIGYRAGDAAASPSAPGADGTWTAATKLATVAVAAGASSVGAGNITDTTSAATLSDVLAGQLPGQFERVGTSSLFGSAVVLTTSFQDAVYSDVTVPSGWTSVTYHCVVAGSVQAGFGSSVSVQAGLDGAEVTVASAIDVGTSGVNTFCLQAFGSVPTTGSKRFVLAAKGTAGGERIVDLTLRVRVVRGG